MKRGIETTPDPQGMGRPMVVECSMLRREAVRYHRRTVPTDQWKLEIDLYGDLAGILSLVANYNGRREPNHSNERSVNLVQEVKVVAGERNHRQLTLPPIAI